MVDSFASSVDSLIGLSILPMMIWGIILSIKFLLKSNKIKETNLLGYYVIVGYGVFLSSRRIYHCSIMGRCYPDPNIATILGIFIFTIINIVIVGGIIKHTKKRSYARDLALNPILIQLIAEGIKYINK